MINGEDVGARSAIDLIRESARPVLVAFEHSDPESRDPSRRRRRRRCDSDSDSASSDGGGGGGSGFWDPFSLGAKRKPRSSSEGEGLLVEGDPPSTRKNSGGLLGGLLGASAAADAASADRSATTRPSPPPNPQRARSFALAEADGFAPALLPSETAFAAVPAAMHYPLPQNAIELETADKGGASRARVGRAAGKIFVTNYRVLHHVELDSVQP